MQSVTAAFTAEEDDHVRKIAQNLNVAWHRQSTLGNKLFTIGVSTIGGNDLIGVTPGAIGSPANYKYFNESAYVTSLAWERGYNMPTGGLTKALAEARLDNTSGRFTPRYMGGNSELFTAILPRRPMTISAGFNFGTDYTIPQFAGVISQQPFLDTRNKELSIQGADYIDFFQNKYLDHAVMFTGQRTDQVMTTLSTQLGMSTAQYDYDTGINVIPFGMFDVGTKFSDIFHQLAEAENGHYYQDESGIFKFENRQHWLNSPYTQIQKIILTGQVINAQAPNADHLINVVEVRGKTLNKQPAQIVFTLSQPQLLGAATDTPIFVNFDDPMLQIFTPDIFVANSSSDGTGTDLSTSTHIKSIDKFSNAAKITFTNTSAMPSYLTDLQIYGRPVKKTADLYYRAQDDSSVTANQEHTYTIENDFIQNPDWAASYARMLLDDYSNIENLQVVTIRAIPELQLGDLISWQGRYWRIFDIKATLDPSQGFIQDLTLLQRSTASYFRIGFSTIAGSDKIAP